MSFHHLRMMFNLIFSVFIKTVWYLPSLCRSGHVRFTPQKWFIYFQIQYLWGFPGGSDGKDSAHNTGGSGLIPGSGRSPGGGNGKPLQYSCLGNPMDREAWWATIHGVAKSQTRLSDFTFTFHFHALEKEMATHSSVLAWRIPGTVSLVGCRIWSCTESDTTDVT